MPPLPFDTTAEIRDQSNAVKAADIPCAVWRLGSPRTAANGEVFDWYGQVSPTAAAELVLKVNRTMIVGGRRLKVISAIEHRYLPHVAVELREIRAGGGA